MENLQQTVSEMIRQFSSSKKSFESKLGFLNVVRKYFKKDLLAVVFAPLQTESVC